VTYLPDGLKNKGKNCHLFLREEGKNEWQRKRNDSWKERLLTPQAIVGGVRGMHSPHLLYKAPMKRVNKFSKEIYAVELSGVNNLGQYYLSKHLFNTSFLCDPFLK